MVDAPDPDRPLRVVGRCEMFAPIASGGFGSVHLGRQVGAGGFSRIVAIKCLHGTLLDDPEVVAMFLDEARVVARIRHPNVLQTLDLVDEEGELFIVMEYLEGVTLNLLLKNVKKQRRRIPMGVTSAVMQGALAGLHAAHEAKNERGEALELIHRDVSPDNIMIGIDGYARLVDFGIARAVGQLHSTQRGDVKGKLHYMTPEQVMGEPLSRRTDVFSAAVVLWQMLTGKRLFEGEHAGELAYRVCHVDIPLPSAINPDVPTALERVVMRGLERNPEDRWRSALTMAEALAAASEEIATPKEVSELIVDSCPSFLRKRAAQVEMVENAPLDTEPVSALSGRYEAMATSSSARAARSVDDTSNPSTRITSSLQTPSARPASRGVLLGAVGMVGVGALLAAAVLRDDAPPTPAAVGPTANLEPKGAATTSPTVPTATVLATPTASASTTASASASSASVVAEPKPPTVPRFVPKTKPPSVYSRE